MQNQSTAITTTAACDLGRHQQCRTVVLTLTQAGPVECRCPCHGRVADLPDAWKALAVLTPPCDDDLDLADLTDDDEAALEAVAELQVEAALEAVHFGAEL
jgi:hypothetical protein